MSSDEINKASSDKTNTNATTADNANTISSNNIVAPSSDDIIATSPTDANKASPNLSSDSTSTLPSSNNVAASTSTTTFHASATTASIKRKLASPDAQESSHESSAKKVRALSDFDYIRDTFGYSFKDLRLLDEALDTTGIRYRVQSNQSLALIGDSILQLTIYRDWYPSRQLKGM